MKKYALILLAFLLIGVVLTYLFFTQEERLDQGVFTSTTESIRNLQRLDKNLLIELHASAYTNDFSSEKLLDLHYEISEEYDNLRYEALFEEIEASESLSNVVNRFDENFAQRETALEEYIDINQSVTNAISALSGYSGQIANVDWGSESDVILKTLLKVDAEVSVLPIGGDIADPTELKWVLADLPKNIGTPQAALLEGFKVATVGVLDGYPQRNEIFNNLLNLKTGPLLDDIEREYVNYHNQAIGESNLFRNALILYGLALLCALLFFGWQIRRNFLDLEQQVVDRTAEIQTAYEDLQESQEQLIQSEKMASLGQMVAGVAHEINTPLGYVSSNVEMVSSNLNDVGSLFGQIDTLYELVAAQTKDKQKISLELVSLLKQYRQLNAQESAVESSELLDDSRHGLSEISNLVLSLKDFARLDRQTFEEINIHDCIESSLTIGSNQLKENRVEVVRQYQDVPLIECIPSKLNQLFLNIISNACHAMRAEGGELTIATRANQESVEVSITDEGHGMDQATLQKVFDPFFTTKTIGSGTGLGMSIAYKIVQAHAGDISIESTPGAGTTLHVSLPVDRAQDHDR